MNAAPRSTRAIVDNWQLEYVCRLFEGSFPRKAADGYGLFSEGLSDTEWDLQVLDSCRALFQLLDLAILSDEILHDSDWDVTWKWSSLAPAIGSLTSPVAVSSETKRQLRESLKCALMPARDPEGGLVAEGALYYLALSHALSAYYWPVPVRARFLIRHLGAAGAGAGFIVVLGRHIDTQVKAMLGDLAPLWSSARNGLPFWGIGTVVLANSASRDDVFPTAMQLRNSKECKAFRKWLAEMDAALDRGDLISITQSLKGVREVMDSIRRKYRLGSNEVHSPRLQIGLSPSVSLDFSVIRKLFGDVRWRQYHLVFLRHSLELLLRNADVWAHTKRLFPEIADFEVRLSRAGWLTGT